MSDPTHTASDPDSDLKHTPSNPDSDLKHTFDQIWSKIRGARLSAGQARSETSIQSVILAQQALKLATESGRDPFLVEAWRMLALTLNANEQFQESATYYKKAIEKLEQLGDLAIAARMRIGYVTVLANTAQYREAIEAARPAERWFEKEKDDHARARLSINLGIVYARLNDHTKAAESYAKARGIFQALGDKEGIAKTSLNLANILSNVDEFDAADVLYEQCRNLSDELQLHELSVQAGYNRAYLQYLRGRYSDALNSFGRLRQRFQVTGSRRHSALCDLDEAQIYVDLGLSKDAATLAKRAIQEFETLGMPLEQAKVTAVYGVALMQMGCFAEALQTFSDSSEIFEQSSNSYWAGLLNLYRAEVHISLRHLTEAQALAKEAKAIFERMQIPSKRIFSLVLLGRVGLELDDVAAAQAATTEISRLIAATKTPLVLFPYHVLCAEIAEGQHKWDEAQHYYERAVQELEQHQTRLHHDDLRVTFLKGRHKAYDGLVRLSLDRMDSGEDVAAAYGWCERARSRGLVELLSHYSPALHSEAEKSLVAKANQLREELNAEYARSQPEFRPLAAQADYETIAFKEQELARTLREISTVDPEYASLQQVSIATLESLRDALLDKTTVVEYFTAGDEILAFIVNRTGARVVRRLCSSERILNAQERLGFQIEKFQLGPDYIATHAEQILESTKRHLQALYGYLVAPFIDEIKTPHITVVPHGGLHFLPFHAFFDGQQYLIDRFEVSYAPSASILKYCLEKQEAPGANPLLVAVPDDKAPLVDDEVRTIATLFPNARTLHAEAATRAAFVEASASSSFIHIATHAFFRHDNPMFSSFKLADGYFTAFDLFSLACPTNLVTLSGCQSGMSEVSGSDDLLGLMRGFLYAGARSLLVSLWNVDDESTTALMVDFYREWQKGAAKSTALRSAMLAVRRSQPNPFYWAPFLLVGHP